MIDELLGELNEFEKQKCEIDLKIKVARSNIFNFIKEHGEPIVSKKHLCKVSIISRRNFKWNLTKLKDFLISMEKNPKMFIRSKVSESVELKEVDKLIKECPELEKPLSLIGNKTISENLVIKRL